MNIPNSMWDAAEKRGLDWIATGGGCDFIWRGVGKGESRAGDMHGVDLVLSSLPLDGTSPDRLDEPCSVAIYINDPEWLDGTFVEFDNANAAMDFMASASNAWTPKSVESDESDDGIRW